MAKNNDKKIARIQSKIDANVRKIKELLNQNIDLEDEQNGLRNYWEKTVKIPIKEGRKIVGHREEVHGFIKWFEDFMDEDTGKAFTIERNSICRINGKPVDMFHREIVKHKINE